MNTFTKSIELLHRALDASTLRYEVSADNLANSGVPNFKKKKVNFESELKQAFESEENISSFEMAATDPRHIKIENKQDWRTVEPRRVTDWQTTLKPNGDNVDAEEEAMNILKTQMLYRLLTSLENHEFSQMKIAMKR